jgi:hypothetical protein
MVGLGKRIFFCEEQPAKADFQLNAIMEKNMKSSLFCALLLLASVATAAEDDAALKQQMNKECAAVFAPGGPCADLAKGTRKCTRMNLEIGGPSCVSFEKAHKEFFDAGMNDPIIHK